jgi:hypothetical protein
LSFTMSNRMQVTLKRQTINCHCYPQYIISRFLAGNRNSGTPEDSSIFIS